MQVFNVTSQASLKSLGTSLKSGLESFRSSLKSFTAHQVSSHYPR